MGIKKTILPLLSSITKRVMQLNTNNNNNTNTPSKNNLFAHDTWILTKEFYQQHLSLPFLSINFQFYQKYHLLTINNYHHLTFSHENRKNSLLKSLFLFGVFNENKKKSLSFHSSTKIYLKNIINQKYFLCQRFLTFYKYSRFLLKNTFNFIKKSDFNTVDFKNSLYRFIKIRNC